MRKKNEKIWLNNSWEKWKSIGLFDGPTRKYKKYEVSTFLFNLYVGHIIMSKTWKWIQFFLGKKKKKRIEIFFLLHEV